MEVSLEAKRNGVAFRRPTFVNPLPKLFKGFINFFESVGRARASAELSRQGYHEEARRLMLREDEL